MSNHITLLVPGLTQPPVPLAQLSEADRPAFDHLNLFFTRAISEKYSGASYYHTLFHLFGVQTDVQSDPPVAAITRFVDKPLLDTEWTLRCDPTYIHADMDRAVLMGHGNLALEIDEVEQLLMIINSHVEQDGWQIEAHTVDRWYVKGADKTHISTTPPQTILGEDLKHDLPQGQDAGYWCSIMNEVQMLLHDLPVNQARLAQGLMPVNSLWFWGGGQLPDRGYCPFDKIYTGDPLAQGLAMYNNCKAGASDDIWLDLVRNDEQQFLMVIDGLSLPGIKVDIFAWLDAVKRFEQTVMEKLISMLKQKQLAEINLLDGHGHRYSLSAKQLRQWWKRSKTYSSLIEKGGS